MKTTTTTTTTKKKKKQVSTYNDKLVWASFQTNVESLRVESFYFDQNP